jgi:phage shock protein A
MEKDNLEILLEDIRGKFDLVLEGHEVLRKEILDTRQELCEKISFVDFKVDALDKKVGTLDKKVDTLDKKVGTLDKKVDTLDKKVGTLDKKVDTLDKKVGTLDKNLDAVAADLTAHRADTEVHKRVYKVKEE